MATANLGITLPTVGGSTDTWGTELNTGLTAIDALFSLTGTDVSMSDITFATITSNGLATLSSVKIGGDGATVTGIKDEDNMSSNSAVKLATQQSIKAYVDAQVGSFDTLAEVLAAGNTTGSTDIVVTAGQKITTDTISETTSAAGVTIDSVLLRDNVVTATSLAGTLTTAAQANVTSLGTLTALQVDNLNLNGNTISSTAGTDLLITPLAGQQLVLDGTIVVDAGVITGATSITSTAFVGDLTGDVTGDLDGNVTGTAATVTGATQAAITTTANLVTVGTIGTGVWQGTAVADAYVANDLTISGGTVNNSVIGGSTAAAITGTTLKADTSLELATGATVTGIDNGSLGSSATLLATQGAIKTYVDAQVATADSLAEVLGNGNSTGGTNLVVTAGDSLTTNTISETTADSGVTIDSVLLKDNSVTATTFTGSLSGNATGSAATVTGATQAAITTAANLVSVGTITTGVWNGTAVTGDYLDVTTSPLANTKIWIGDSSGDAQEFALSGDVTMSAGGAVTVADNAITLAKLEDGTSGDILYYAASGVPTRLAKGTDTQILTLSSGLPSWSDPSATTVAPAGTLTGTTLASNVVTSSLTTVGTLTSLNVSGAIDVDGTANLDVVDIDGAVDMASTLQVDGASTFSSNVSMTVADNSAGLQVICTDGDASAGPLILLDRDTGSPADGDTLGRIYNQGRNDADELITYAQITTKSNDVTDGTEDGEMLINVMTNGSATSVMSITGAEIQMDATAVDLNGTLDVSGTSTLTGNVSAGADIIIGATDKIRLDGSASGNTYLSESSADVVTLTTEGIDSFRFASSGGNPYIRLEAGNTGVGAIQYYENDGGSGQVLHFQAGVRGADNKYYISSNATIHTNYAIQCSGEDVAVGGALSKGSGSFKIDHPLPSMKDTHDLYHSFIEGPRADLIYRGSVDLVAGYVQVDLDEAAGMTEGTWELLCRDPQVFLQNDSGWAAVRGSVEGSVLTIDCADTDSVDTVSWMVVAERQDEHMMETNWTDSNGRVIVEPEKPEDVEDGS